MEYLLSWSATMIVFLVALVIGIVTAFVIRDGALRALWAILVTLVFIGAAMTAVIFGYSWMFTETAREQAQIVALGAALTGIVYAIRAPR
jgi:flagellar motor component MotA